MYEGICRICGVFRLIVWYLMSELSVHLFGDVLSVIHSMLVRSKTLVLWFQELLVILFLVIMVTPLQPKIRITTAGVVTMLWGLKEPGGTRAVITPIWTVCITTENTHHTLMVSTGLTGKDISTPPRELRWKSDQSSFKNFLHFSRLFANTKFVKLSKLYCD